MKITPFCVFTGLLFAASVGAFSQGQRTFRYSDGTTQTTGAPKAKYSYDDKTPQVNYKRAENKSSYTSPTRPHVLSEAEKKELRKKEDKNKPAVVSAPVPRNIHDGLEPAEDNRPFAPTRLLFGYIDVTGKLAIPYQFGSVGNFDSGTAIVSKYYDDNGKEVLPYEDQYHNRSKQRWGVIDKTGKQIIPCQYESIYLFRCGLAPVKKDGKYGYLNRSGEVVVPFIYDRADLFYGGYAQVHINHKFGLIDTAGNVIVPLVYDGVSDLSYCFAAVKKNGKCGYVNEKGVEVIPLVYDNALNFYDEGIAPVSIADKWGFIDKTGTIVIPVQFAETYSFMNGIAKVTDGDHKTYFIDKTGKRIDDKNRTDQWGKSN